MTPLVAELGDVWPFALAIGLPVLDAVAMGHVVLTKDDTRAATGWVVLIFVLPLAGVLLYWMLGINRVKRRAHRRQAGYVRRYPAEQRALEDALSARGGVQLAKLAEMMDRVSERPLLGGNDIEPLENGETAYPAMLDAIREATQSVTLSSYIFDRGRWGSRFVDALAAAVKRGVQVRVLIDAIGARYSLPTIAHTLKKRGVPVARFGRTLVPWRWTYANLRNHRKICVIDGAIAFTGGMNIRDGHVVSDAPKHPITDLHFRLSGPVVGQLQAVFSEDWTFTTGELLEGERWFPTLSPRGAMHARTVTDGPDDDLDKFLWTVLGGLSYAERHVWLCSPYFLPEAELVRALELARYRGIEVDILIPKNNNHRMVQWASNAILPHLLNSGCRVWAVDGPFDHTKAMLVDESWVLFGSANLDPRSMRLNFEAVVEAYSLELATRVKTLLEAKRDNATEITAADLRNRNFLVRVRDGFIRLFTPYL